jgi:hypothetical protein
MSELAISIRQPWAWLILHAGKDVENRGWPTKVRGRVLIHTGKGMSAEEYEEVRDDFLPFEIEPFTKQKVQLPGFWELERGGIVGEVEIIQCVNSCSSSWFVGPYGFVLRNAKPLPFQACRGALGFFKPVFV